jgi:hypothetical protein
MVLTDHLWFSFTEQFKQLNLRSGDIIEFNARATLYEKGYRDDDEENPKRLDYRLSYPSKVVKCGHAEKDYSYYDTQNAEVEKRIAEHEARRQKAIAEWIEQKNNPQPKSIPERKVVTAQNQDSKLERNAKLTEFI